MAQIVKDVAVGTTPLEYRRVDCPREGAAVVGVVGNPYWMEISVMNLARSGSYDAMRVKDAGGAWKDLGGIGAPTSSSNEQLRGNISVEISDSATGDRVTLTDCIPEGWTTNTNYACDVNYGIVDRGPTVPAAAPPDQPPASPETGRTADVPAAPPVRPESQDGADGRRGHVCLRVHVRAEARVKVSMASIYLRERHRTFFQ